MNNPIPEIGFQGGDSGKENPSITAYKRVVEGVTVYMCQTYTNLYYMYLKIRMKT